MSRITKCGFYPADCFFFAVFLRNTRQYNPWPSGKYQWRLEYLVFGCRKTLSSQNEKEKQNYAEDGFIRYWNSDNDRTGQSLRHLEKQLVENLPFLFHIQRWSSTTMTVYV
jgi:hypothetical protein